MSASPEHLPPFQRLLDAHRQDVWRLLVAAVGREEADDCFQETFLSALRAYPRLRPGSNLRAWLLTIAHRKALDAHRARKRRPALVAVASSVEPAAMPTDREDDLWCKVSALPARQRAAVLLRYVADLSHRDAAGAIGCSEAAARRSLHEALKNLREVWTP